MTLWIEVKARYEKMTDSGVQKRVTEAYLVDAISCTEAEARVIKKITPFSSGNLSLISIKKVNIAELFTKYNGDRLYKVKVNFITIDEKTAAEKKTASYIIVPAETFKEAYTNFIDGMKGTMADFEIEAISETRYIDYFPAILSTNETGKADA